MRRAAILLLTGVVAALVPLGSARGADVSELDVKAAFLPRFARYVTWPPAAMPQRARSLVLCVIGDDPFGACSSRRHGRSRSTAGGIVVRRMNSTAGATVARSLSSAAAARDRTGRLPQLRQPAGADGDRFDQRRRRAASSISSSSAGGCGSTSTRPRPSGRSSPSARGCWRWPSGSTSDRAAAVSGHASTLALGAARHFRDRAADPGRRHRVIFQFNAAYTQAADRSRRKASPTCLPHRSAPQSISTIRAAAQQAVDAFRVDSRSA